MPIHSTQVVRIDGLMLAASVEDSAGDTDRVNALKSQQRAIIKGMNINSAYRANIDSGDFLLHYLRQDDIVFFAITERAFPKNLAQMYLDDISKEFSINLGNKDYRSMSLRPYAFNDFDTFIQRTKKSYENPRASDNLDKLDAQLKETTQIMSKNLEDLLYRGDSLDKMGQMSSDLKESSKKYKRAAARINWELLLKQVPMPNPQPRFAPQNPREAFQSQPNVLIQDSTALMRGYHSSSSSSSSGDSGDNIPPFRPLPPGLWPWYDLINGRTWLPSSELFMMPHIVVSKFFPPDEAKKANDARFPKKPELPAYKQESAWVAVQKTMREDFKWAPSPYDPRLRNVRK